MSGWKDLGAVVCWDTDGKGAKRRDKNAKEWSGGSGVLELNGQPVRVFVSVRKGGRPGSFVVSISQPPPDGAGQPPQAT